MNLDDYIFECTTCHDSQQVRVPASHSYKPCPDCAPKEKPEPMRFEMRCKHCHRVVYIGIESDPEEALGGDLDRNPCWVCGESLAGVLVTQVASPEPAKSLWGAPKRETPTPFDAPEFKKALTESIVARQADPCKFKFQHAMMSDGTSKPNTFEVTLANAMALSRLCLRFGRTFRVTQDAVGHPESDTTHSLMLALLAGELAPREAIPMDRFVVAALALVHDIAEVYAGDTNTIRRLSTTDAENKAAREQVALQQIRDELAGFSWILELIDRYERQLCNESRFVKYLDKALPGLTHHDNDGAVLRGMGFDVQSLRERNDIQDAELHRRFPEFAFTRKLLQTVYSHIEKVLWRSPASKPEPPPTGKGEPVTPSLLTALRDHPDLHALVVARDAFGRSKYGTGLRIDNGRDALEDARQELGDLMQYLWQAKMEGKDITPVLNKLARALSVLQGGK